MARIRIYTDEHVDPDIAAALVQRGIEAWTVRDAGHYGLSDAEHMEYTVCERAVIFTHDADFLTLARRWEREGRDHWGVVYARQGRLSVGECVRRLCEVVSVLDAEELRNRIEYL